MNPPEPTASAPGPYLFLTAHDVRSRRRTNIHFIAAELARRAPTRVFSLAFSPLSRLRGRDPRLGLEPRANAVETVDGIEAFLWMTPAHPGNPRAKPLQALSPLAFELYRRAAPPLLRAWIAQAGTVFAEAGAAIVFIAEVRRLNPRACIVYLASDDLETVRVDPYVRRRLRDCGPLLTRAVLPSRALGASMPPATPMAFVPHGVDKAALDAPTPSPYPPGRHAVSVGSMLFDPVIVCAAATAHPQVGFHVIGSGPRFNAPANVTQHPETPFAETLPYLQHADIGLAPYGGEGAPDYLADTSMKLLQYGWLGLPAVCPNFAVGGRRLRFGYDPADRGSVGEAIGRALAAAHVRDEAVLSWREVTDRLLDPAAYADTAM